MRISQVKRNTMTSMISDVRLSSKVSSVRPVESINAIDTSNNAMSSSSASIMKESFYDKLEDKKTNQDKKITVEEEKREKKSLYTVSNKDKQTLDFIKNMLSRFNKSMENVKKIDIARGQKDFFNIKKVIDENSRFLASIGIFTDKIGNFYIKEDVFVENIMKNPNNIKILLEPSNGVIRKICDSFGKMLVY